MTFAVPDTPDWANTSVTVNAPQLLYKQTLTGSSVKSVFTPLIDVNAYSTALVVLIGDNTFGMDAVIAFDSAQGLQARHALSVGATPAASNGFDTFITLPSPGGNLEAVFSADAPQTWLMEVQVWGILHFGLPLDTVTVLTTDPNSAGVGHLPTGEGASFGLTISATSGTVSLWPMVFRPGLQELQYYLRTPITAGSLRFNIVDLRTGRTVFSQYQGASATALSDHIPFRATAPYRIDLVPDSTLAPSVPLYVSVTVPTVLGRQ